MEWISVKDRLPETGRQVLVYSKRRKNGYISVVSPRRGIMVEDGVWVGAGAIDLQEPTHWMPLPDPPEEAEK